MFHDILRIDRVIEVKVRKGCVESVYGDSDSSTREKNAKVNINDKSMTIGGKC